jgi:hypothetical protein
VLVRRVKQGTTWHPATDDLKGIDVYGTYGNDTSPETFSVAFSPWLSQSTEFLFMTGVPNDLQLTLCFVLISILLAGDRKMWLIATYVSINNNFKAYGPGWRNIVKSSTSSDPCMFFDFGFFFFCRLKPFMDT